MEGIYIVKRIEMDTDKSFRSYKNLSAQTNYKNILYSSKQYTHI